MAQEILNMGRHKLTLKKGKSCFSLFSRKNGEIYICLDQKGDINKYTLSAKSAKIVAEKLQKMAQQAEYLESIQNTENNDENAYHHEPGINEQMITDLLDDIAQGSEEGND